MSQTKYFFHCLNDCAPFFAVTAEEAAQQGDEPRCSMCEDKDSPRKLPPIIGLSGHKGSGKDTAADFLRRYGYHKVAFADSLKKACKAIFGFTDEQLHDPKKKEEVDPFWGFSPRWALQRVGTEGVRTQIGTDVWVRSLFRNAPTDRPLVVSDVRFQNELDAMRERGGQGWLVQRGGCRGDGHASEEMARHPELFDIVVENNGTVGEFQQQITARLSGKP